MVIELPVITEFAIRGLANRNLIFVSAAHWLGVLTEAKLLAQIVTLLAFLTHTQETILGC